MTAETNGIIAAQANKQIAKNENKKTLQGYIKAMSGEIKKALPSVITPERFTRIVLSAVSSNPTLAECTPDSFLSAMMTSAQLGLEVNTPLGQASLVPRRNNKKGVLECQFQIGYKGLIDLAYRSGDVSIVQAHAVHENDEFEYELGITPKLRHIPTMTNRGKVTCYYAMFKTKDGGYGFGVMSVEEIREFARAKSPSYNSGAWQTDFDEMAKKTVVKKVLKYAPLKSDFIRAVAQDESIKTEIDADMYSVPAEKISYVEVDENGEVMNDEEQKQ